MDKNETFIVKNGANKLDNPKSNGSRTIHHLYCLLQLTESYCSKHASIELRQKVEEMVYDDLSISGERSFLSALLDSSLSPNSVSPDELSRLKDDITVANDKLKIKKRAYIKACLVAIIEGKTGKRIKSYW